MFFRIIVWMFREHKKRKKDEKSSGKVQPRDLGALEREENLNKDDTDGKPEPKFIKRPKTYDLLCVWGLIETLILASVMIFKKKDYGVNFMHDLCKNNDCKNFVFNALIYKIVCSILLTIGAKTVSHFSRVFFCVNQNL